MITDLIAELKAAEAKATPAPWEAYPNYGLYARGERLVLMSPDDDAEFEKWEDVKLVALARNAIRPLLEHVEAQRRQLEIAESLLSGYGKREYARLAAMASEGEE